MNEHDARRSRQLLPSLIDPRWYDNYWYGDDDPEWRRIRALLRFLRSFVQRWGEMRDRIRLRRWRRTEHALKPWRAQK